MGRRQQAARGLPGLLVVVLCALAMVAGMRLHLGLRARPKAPAKAKESSQQEGLAATLSNASPLDPLHPVQLERHMLGGGLLTVRPPVLAAASGDDWLHAIPFQILSWFPRLVVFPAFLDKERCDHIIALAKRNMEPSGLAYRPGEREEEDQQTRTSKGTFLMASQDPDGVLAWVEERIAAATRLPVTNGEAFNVLQYEVAAHYDSHMDSFDPQEFGPQPNQRIATVLIYLTDVEEGGETIFKKEGVDGDQRPVLDWRSCSEASAYKYSPRRGDAVLFWSVGPDGTIDPRSLHGGCPVVRGEKWVVTKWIRAIEGV